MNAVSPLIEGIQWAHELLEMVTADITPEQAHWQPPGIANPLGAIYAHAVLAEDAVVNAMLKGSAPLFSSEWAGKTGIANPQFQLDLEWARNLELDLPAFREYAQAVYATTIDYVSSLSATDLSGEIDMTSMGLGQRSLSWCLNALVISHLNNMIGEISCLKGLQGAKGYPS
jgi:hypothetical protein